MDGDGVSMIFFYVLYNYTPICNPFNKQYVDERWMYKCSVDERWMYKCSVDERCLNGLWTINERSMEGPWMIDSTNNILSLP